MKKIIFALLIVFALLVCPIIADTSVTLDEYSLCTVAKQGDGTDPWTTLQSATTGSSSSCGSPNYAYMRIPATAITSEYAQFARGFITFNTNIGPTNEWKSGILSIKVSAPLDDFNSNLSIGLAYPDTPGTVGNSDYNNWDTSEYGEIDISGMSEGNWYNITIDVSDFSNVGYTVLSALAAIDKYNTPPAWISAAETRVKIIDAKLYGTYGAITTPTPTPTIPPTANYEVIVHGTNTEPISGAEVTLWYDGILQDTSTTGSSGIIYYDVPLYRWVNGTVTKSGYQNATFSQYINYWDTWSSVTLYTDTETPGTGDEYWNYVVTFRDASTLATLTNVKIDVYTDSGRTDLFLSDNAPYGVWTGLLPNDTTYYFTASAANHVNATWSYTLSGASVSVYKDLIPVAYGSLQPVLNIFVYDTGGTALKDVGITVDSDIDDGFHLTNITGYARHFCDNLAYGTSRNYTVTASKGGYVTETSTVTVSTQQPAVYIFMEKSTIATATLTGIYTPVVTPVWSGDGGTPGNIKEQLINTIMTQFGVSQLEANILMGIVLTLLCAVVVGGGLASYGSGSGAGVGAMIGAVVGFSGSSIIGFFPIWILIVVIVLVFASWFMFRGREE
jgi:hypothetical protein